jgi:hypothetical protein
VLDLYKQIPPTRITDLLLEVDAANRLLRGVHPSAHRRALRDRIGLMNVIAGGRVNLGLRKMADATNTHTFWELIRIARWHVEGEAYDRALAMVVEAQALTHGPFWGKGNRHRATGSSSPLPSRARP